MARLFILVLLAMVLLANVSGSNRYAFSTLFRKAGIRRSTSHMSDEDIRNTAIVEIKKCTRGRLSAAFLQSQDNGYLYDRLREITNIFT